MSKRKPVIGITGPVRGGTSAWWFTALAVWMQGGRPIRIYPGKPRDEVKLDGLILGGGADINPKRYGALLEQGSSEKPSPRGLRGWIIRFVSILFYPLVFLLRNLFSTKNVKTDTARDELEFALLDRACSRGIPVLGICRGAQLINVKFGGTLHQDISGFYTEVPKPHTIWPRKTIEVHDNTLLGTITNTTRVLVNALHNQAVDRLGDDLRMAATESNGVVQAIEHTRYPYMLGVQWHPEYMPQVPLQRKIFDGLVCEARKRKGASATEAPTA